MPSHAKLTRLTQAPKTSSPNPEEQGISLLEIVVVLAVVAIITAIGLSVIPSLLRQHKLSKVVATQAVLRNIASKHMHSLAYRNVYETPPDFATPPPYKVEHLDTANGITITAKSSDTSFPTMQVIFVGKEASKACNPAGVSADLRSTCENWKGRL